MDSHRFDALARAFAAAGSRRGLLSIVTALPIAGGLAALLGEDEVDAQGRRKRRKKRHKHGKGRHRGGHKKHCQPKSRAKTCAGKCGPVKNTCKKTIDCACAAGQLCDDGACVACDVCAVGCPFTSVQDAIDAASSGDTIRLCGETYGETIDIDKDLTLIGAGEGEDGTVLDGQQSGTVISLTGNRTLTLEGLRITGGSSGGGGGIFIPDGNLTLTDCTVTGNTAEVGGGGIYNPDSTVTLTNCTVSDNTVGSGGGGLYNPGGRVTLNDTIVTGNVAAFGGGIYNPDSTVTLNGTSSVTGNTATDGEGQGGGIDNFGTVTLNDDSSVTQNEPDDCAGSGTYTGNACGP